MKLTLTLFLFSLVSVTASTYSQNTRLDISFKDGNIIELFRQIEEKSEFYFFFQKEELNELDNVTVNAQDATVMEILDEALTGKNMGYKIVDRYIIVRTADDSFGDDFLSSAREMDITQQSAVSGKVTDVTGQALPGVTVVVKGTTQGTVTNEDGEYILSDVPEDATLVFSFVGMHTQEVEVGDQTNIDVTMEEEAIGIEEVVAIGYGTMEKKSLTGAITSIKEDKISTTTATSLAQKLQGKVSGLNIRQQTGQPGTFENAINIRGFGEPLYIIDGIKRSSTDFQKLNSEGIQDISVLKDASAAIYGLNAANGVIIVTTNSGVKGETEFQFKSRMGFSSPTDIVEPANAYQYLTLRNEANLNMGLESLTSKDELTKWKEGGPGYKSTNWPDATLKDYSQRQEYSLSAQGGSDKVTYYLNINIIDDGGILRSEDIDYDKLSFRSNVSAELSENLEVTARFSAYYDEQKNPWMGIFNIWRGTISAKPTQSVYANDNPKYFNRVRSGQAFNPVPIADADLTGFNENKNRVFMPNIDLIYDVPFIKGLEVKGVASYYKNFHMGKDVQIDYKMYDYDSETDTYIPTTYQDPATIQNDYNNSSNLTLQAQINYETTIAEAHNINGSLIYEQKNNFWRWAGIHKYFDFYTNPQIDQASEEDATSWGSENTEKYMSYIGRLSYNYKEKYLIDMAGRYDGSYRYHPDHRWGLFPQVSVGWRLSEENFMKNALPSLSNLKLRGSYGMIGEDAGAPFQYMTGFSTGGGGWWEFTEGKETEGVATPSLTNEELTWMESTIMDIGIDVGFFDNKISFVADVYQKTREGIPAYRSVTLPNTYGGSFPQENLNSDRVKGIEFSIDHHNRIGDLIYEISGNIDFGRSKNLYMEHSPYRSSWDKYRRGVGSNWFWGSSQHTSYRYDDAVWTYNVNGRLQSEEEITTAPVQNGSNGDMYVLPGDFDYEDVNGDGVIDGNDMVPNFYDENPKMHYGFTFDASWKGFDFSALLQGAALFSVHFTHAYGMPFFPGEDSNLPAHFFDRWRRADPNNPESEWIAGKYPAMRTSKYTGALYQENEFWRHDCSYLRIKNLQLGYTFDSGIISDRIGINKVRVYFNGRNLYTFAEEYVKSFDPEKVSGFINTGWVYPITRSYTIGVNINF